MKATSGLLDPRATAVLDRLHARAKGDAWKMAARLPIFALRRLRGQTMFEAATPELMKDIYIPIDPNKGRFLYLTARAIGAKTIVEFGTSFGISTIYLAAAVRDNGGGIVIGSEIEPSKVAKARENIAEAGLAEFVDVRLGDARETLISTPAQIDMVFLDGWQDLYVPVTQVLTPNLRPGAVVFADNIFTFKKTLRPYVEFMQAPENGFVSTTLSMSDGFEYSVYLGSGRR